MKSINKTTNVVSIHDVIFADSFVAKNLGLIPYNKPKPLRIKTRFGIHTFGMRYPIDVIILDKNKKVVKIKKSLHPNRVFFWNPRYDTVLELPAGTIQEKNISPMDFLSYK